MHRNPHLQTTAGTTAPPDAPPDADGSGTTGASDTVPRPDTHAAPASPQSQPPGGLPAKAAPSASAPRPTPAPVLDPEGHPDLSGTPGTPARAAAPVRFPANRAANTTVTLHGRAPRAPLPPQARPQPSALDEELGRVSDLPLPDARQRRPSWSLNPGPDWKTFADGDIQPEALPPRYQYGREIGRGGQGRILTVFDSDLGRPVAMKTTLDPSHKDPDAARRFIHEVQITGQLEHPNIIPVYELGRLGSGEIFYTMRLVEGRTLAEVIHGLAEGHAETLGEFGRVRLVTILQQICQGMAFAHARGVLHRDLKPANILLGNYGEVTVVDWGCARIMPQGPHSGYPLPDTLEHSENRPVLTYRNRQEDATLTGTVQGTPTYMAPEQAAGDLDRLSPRTDVYALGAILYELLTLKPPFEGENVDARLKAVLSAELIPPRQRAPNQEIPVELEEICLKCLSRDPENRFTSALELYTALESYLEGTLALERRRQEAARCVNFGMTLAHEYEQLIPQHDRLKEQTRRQEREIAPWEAVQRKTRLWRNLDRLEQLQRQQIDKLSQAVRVFHQALSYDSSNREARQSLARLYWSQFQDAERRRDQHDSLYFEALVREFDDGQYARALQGDGRISVKTTPTNARVRIHVYESVYRQLKLQALPQTYSTPIRDLTLPRGSYVLVLKARGHQETRLPIYLGRQYDLSLELRLLQPRESGPDFVHIPGGVFISGGDEAATNGRERNQQWVDDFLIQRYPVTCSQYLEFLNALEAENPGSSRRHAPRPGDSESCYWSQDDEGCWHLPARGLVGQPWDALWPVVGISWEDTQAWCAWRSRVEQREIRLPTGEEWEKAGRGVDGRYFPWGDTFDPSFCKMRDSRATPAMIEPVETFKTDCSPYGVRDMAGGVSEWCSDWFNPQQRLRLLRGGAWNTTAGPCRLASRHGEPPTSVFPWLGFRVVKTIQS